MDDIVKLGHIEKGTGEHQSNVVYGTYGVSPALNACDYKEAIRVVVEDDNEREEVVGSIYLGKSDKFQSGIIADRDVSKTLMTGGECAIIIGNVGSGPSHQRRNVYDSEGIAPTLMASMGMGGGIIPFIAENDEMETPVRLGNVYDEKFGQSFGGGVWDSNGVAPTLKTTAAASQQHVVVENPEVIECNDDIQHQQDLVQSAEGVCRTIAAGTHGSAPHLLKTLVDEPNNKVFKNTKYRIRKLTPKECFRLMGVKDEDSDKVTVSNSQKYKQAGNSIVVDVLMGIFENMFVKECKKSSLF